MKTDITYTIDEFWLTFMPNTPDGEIAWAELNKHGKINIHQLPSVKAQLKAAGYTIRKARQSNNQISDADLLAQLGL